jgi:hypothetical protein
VAQCTSRELPCVTAKGLKTKENDAVTQMTQNLTATRFAGDRQELNFFG